MSGTAVGEGWDGGRPLICTARQAEWADEGDVSTMLVFCPVYGANMVRDARLDRDANPEMPRWCGGGGTEEVRGSGRRWLSRRGPGR